MSDIEKRKNDHIELALQSQSSLGELNNKFFYEPALGHPGKNRTKHKAITLAGKNNPAPFWISSMTGGSTKTGQLNKILAKAAKNVGAGMGLGSCRAALEDLSRIDSFYVRDELGDELPLFANLGIAELEILTKSLKLDPLAKLLENLKADGLIIHLNPMQELLQPEGRCHETNPLETLETLLKNFDAPVIVKEVGQGFGPQSLKALLALDLEAIELAGFGGTNFSKVENYRSKTKHPSLEALCAVGHQAEEMITWINAEENIKCKNIIISGGVAHALDGFYLNSLCKLPSIYGIASRLLSPASESEEQLTEYLTTELKSYKIAEDFLTPKI